MRKRKLWSLRNGDSVSTYDTSDNCFKSDDSSSDSDDHASRRKENKKKQVENKSKQSVSSKHNTKYPTSQSFIDLQILEIIFLL